MGTFWGNLLSLITHTNGEDRKRRRRTGWEDDREGRGGAGGRRCGVAQFPEIHTVTMVTRHNRQRRRRGYVTFGRTAGAEGERSSAWHPHKGLNFHKTEGKECEGSDVRWAHWRVRERARERRRGNDAGGRAEMLQREKKNNRGRRVWVEGEGER